MEQELVVRKFYFENQEYFLILKVEEQMLNLFDHLGNIYKLKNEKFLNAPIIPKIKILKEDLDNHFVQVTDLPFMKNKLFRLGSLDYKNISNIMAYLDKEEKIIYYTNGSFYEKFKLEYIKYNKMINTYIPEKEMKYIDKGSYHKYINKLKCVFVKDSIIVFHKKFNNETQKTLFYFNINNLNLKIENKILRPNKKELYKLAELIYKEQFSEFKKEILKRMM